jgi:alkanesulfonate monooxygenase SsuD/methylene tetrahydromethanopterin reductase-like flavin-dependent oxidoreductase (luciferase family)
MADYGHDLRFGTFITPQAQSPETPVLLAQVSERASLDLVTFQDHPYQPAFLDAWTLLTWAAAKTERIRLSGNVLNLALRPPAVLAKSSASLDLLSGGRFELGIGAGGFWDAIAAYGGPKRTPGESVEAFGEALDIIRALWNPAERRGATVAGKHYSVRGAKRGPEPAHDIPIWVGALKPRMLRLIGRKADGWLPSLPYLQDGDLARGNAIIDEAAAKAGRDPREIRRLLNLGGGPFTVDDLLPYALEHGVSTFILMSDDPETIARFGTEVAPAVRDAVAEARDRAGTSSGGVIRGPRVRERRREGIDYDGLPRSLRAKAIEPGDKAYPKVRSTYMRTGAPGLVIAAESADDVRQALAFAREQDVPLAVRSGGHGISGRSTNDGGIVIDLGRLDAVEPLGSGRVRVGAGARWGRVAEALAPHGLAISSGDSGDVGVGGLATAGGIGFLGRKHGLTIDHVAAAEVVLADGRVVRADPDLLWAIRGAGGNFGIVTSFELDTDPLAGVVFASMAFDGRDAAGAIEAWGALVERAPRELTSFLYVHGRRGDAPLIRTMSVWAGDDTDAAVEALTPLLGIAPLLDQQAARIPYYAVVPAHDAIHRGGVGEPHVSNGFAVHLTDEIAGKVQAGVTSGVAPWVAIRAVGGAVGDVEPDATAFAHRHQRFNVSSVALGAGVDEFRGHWDDLRPALDGLYLSFETDDRPERLTDAFPAPTLARLRELKAKYDPENRFDQNFPIAAPALAG